MIAIPDFSAGAMENWGLITYRETDLLYDENQSSFLNKERVAEVRDNSDLFSTSQLPGLFNQ